MANIALVVLIGVCLSGGLEALQTFLPGRVPSKLDWLANGFGTLLGAAGLALFQPLASDRNALVWHRPLLLRPDSAAMLIMVAIWLLAQTVPQRVLFETGAVVQPLIDLLRIQATAAEVDPQAAPMSAQLAAQLAPWLEDLRVSSDYAVMIEAGAVAAWMAAVGLMMTDTMTASPRRSILVGAVLLAALLIRSASATWLFDGTEVGLWLSAGAQGGLVVGGVALIMLSAARHRTRLWLIVLLLAVGIVLTNVFPTNVYQDAAAPAGEQGAWRNFHALMRAVALLWPFAALLAVALAIHPLRWRRSL